jgi:hypothetical protein
MKHPLYLLLLLTLLAGSCRNNDADKKKVNIATTLPPIPENGILAQWQNPDIIVYQYTENETDRNTTHMRIFGENGFEFDTVLFEDGMVSIDSLVIDTITFSNGRFPEMVFKWHSAGAHTYGPENGGWKLDLQTLSIWDINNLTNIFYSDTYVYGWTSERHYPGDELYDPKNEIITE